MRFEIFFSKERIITPTGIAIAGLLIDKTNFKRRVDAVKIKDRENPQIKNSDVVTLRQRMDLIRENFRNILLEENVRILKSTNAEKL